jgi:hypothetical protein
MEKTSRSGQTKGIRVGGIIREIEKNSFIFDFRTKNREFREEIKELRPRSQKIENNKQNYFVLPTIPTQRVHLIYLTQDSLEGKYKDPEFNLPYEILSENGNLLYRQSIIERKEDILNNLEKTAIEEGIKK